MKAQTLLVTLILALSPSLWAYQAQLSYYVFEAKARSSSGLVELKEDSTPVAIEAPWFDWKCTANKQQDGVLMTCLRGEELVETKVYCNLPQNKQGQLMRLGKQSNFVSFEARCETSIKSVIKAKKKAVAPKAPAAT